MEQIATDLKLEPSWKSLLQEELSLPYMENLKFFLQEQAAEKKAIFPRSTEIFNALNTTPFEKVKAVILGQDPYHGAGQAHGLCFSVQPGVKPPPSLMNIFKEYSSDLGYPLPSSGDLSAWAKEGVLLLNTVLTVEEGKAASHKKRGWEQFTDKIIQKLSERDDPIVFILWGAFAHSKIPMIRVPPHAILKSVHPSPLSAYNGFWGSKHFSKTNEILKSWGKTPIQWRLN